jgi:hypothetical protein
MGGALLQGAACRSERERRRLRLREQTSVGMGSGSTSVGASEEDGASSVLEGRDDGVVEEMEDDGFDEQMFLGLSEPSYVMPLPPNLPSLTHAISQHGDHCPLPASAPGVKLDFAL